MLLSSSTWQEVETYLKASSGIIVPIGSTEQHGPNGVIGTDAMCAEAIAAGVGEATGALVAPVINIGMAQHHMAWPGSITYMPTTLVAVVHDIVFSLARHGFERMFFINGHGGNRDPLSTAFSEIYARASVYPGSVTRVRCVRFEWWEHASVKAISREIFGEHDGTHATCSEISVTQYLSPDNIKTADMESAGPRARKYFDCEDHRSICPDGRSGSWPVLARPEHGQRLYDAAVTALSEEYGAFVSQA
ncbi:MAG: creatininase family protein [Acetobacterales bacterium]